MVDLHGVTSAVCESLCLSSPNWVTVASIHCENVRDADSFAVSTHWLQWHHSALILNHISLAFVIKAVNLEPSGVLCDNIECVPSLDPTVVGPEGLKG